MAEIDEESKMAASDATKSTRTEPSDSPEPAADMAEESMSIDKEPADAERNDGDEETTVAAAAAATGEPAASQDAEIQDEEPSRPLPAAASDNDDDAFAKEPAAADSDTAAPVADPEKPALQQEKIPLDKLTLTAQEKPALQQEKIPLDKLILTAPEKAALQQEKMLQDKLTVSESTKADGSVVITENGPNARMEREVSPIVIDDESDDEAVSDKSPKKTNRSNQPRKTRLECSFIDGSFCCVTCDYKTPSNIAFASHVVIHLHRAGDNGTRLCNKCKCDKIIDVVKNCPLVRNMMKLLVEQKHKWKQEQEGKGETGEKATENSSPSAETLNHVDTSTTNDNAVQMDEDLGEVNITSQALLRNRQEIMPASAEDQSSETNKCRKASKALQSAKAVNGSGNIRTSDQVGLVEKAPRTSPVVKPKSPMPSTVKKATGKKSTAVKIIYENGMFNCKTCNYRTENELAFRKHLWKDLHKKLECSHCPEHIVYDKFNHCTLLGQFMKYMYQNYKQSSPSSDRSSTSPASIRKISPLGKTVARSQSPASATASPVACSKSSDVSATDTEISIFQTYEAMTSGTQSENLDSNQVQDKSKAGPATVVSDENDISQTLAMLDGLNQAQNQGPITEESAKLDDVQDAVDAEKGMDRGMANASEKTAETDLKLVEAGEGNGVIDSDPTMVVDEPENQDEQAVIDEDKNEPMDCITDEKGAESQILSERIEPTTRSKGYVCPVEGCHSWTTQSQTQFKSHLQSKHNGITSIQCAYCSQLFDNEDGLISHIDSEHMKFDRSKFLFRCSFDGCEFSSNVVIDFRVHNIIKHKSATSFKCCHCAQTFDTTESLISHIQSNILNLAQCTICRCTSTNKNIITKHIRSVHPGEPRKINMEVYVCCQPEVFTAHIPESTNSKGTVPPIILRRKETTYLCPCEFVAKDIYAFKEHINTCSMHRKKTIYVVPPVVTSIQAPAKGGSIPDKPTKPTDDTVAGALTAETNIPDDVPMDFEEGAGITEPVPESEDQDPETDPAQPSVEPDREMSLEPDSPESADVGDTDLNNEIEEPNEPEPIPEPEPRLSVYDQLGLNQELKCDQCSYTTCFDKFHESHKKVHSLSKDPSKPFVCQQCPYYTENEKAFVFHYNCHQGRKILRVYQCKYCELTSNQNDFIEEHLLDKHPDDEIRFECAPRKLDSVTCMECEMKFPTEKELLDHAKGTHGESALKSYSEIVYGITVECSEEPDEEPPPQPEEAEPPALSIAPTNMPERRVISISPIPDSEVNMSEGHLSCTYCSYATHDVEQWKQHLKKHIGVGSLQLVMYCCRMCDWPSNDTKRVIDHCMKEHFMSGEQARDGGYENNYLEISAKESEENSRNEFSATDEAAWEIPVSVSIEKYHCDVCEFSTNEKATLSKHKLENHGTIEDDEDDSYGPPARTDRPNSMMLSNNYYGTRYPGQVSSRDRYICSMCPYTTDKAKHWHCHKVTHEKQMAIVNGLKCGYCKTLATKLNTMRYHHNRYHGVLPHKFFKVSNGAVLDQLVVNPEDMVTGGSPYQPTLPSSDQQTKQSGVMLKELLTVERRRRSQQNHQSGASGSRSSQLLEPMVSAFDDEDSNDSSTNDGSVIEEEEVESNEEYQDETHILTKGRPQEDPSKYCYKIPGQDLHQCIKCYFTHKYPSKVQRHFRYRHEKFCPYRCGYCNFSSVESPKIRRHIHMMHKNVPVKILATSSDSPSVETTEEFRAERAAAMGVQEDLEYIVHKFIAKGEGNMQCCLLCGYKQEGASSLKRHLFAIHLQYYPYKCKYCDITAIERNKIVKHLERTHPQLEMRLVRLKFKGPLPEIPEHLKGMVGSDYIPGTDDSQTGESDVMDQDDDQATGLGLKITNVASVPSRDSHSVSSMEWSNNYGSLFNKGNITSAHISLNSETGHPIVTVKEEPISDDAGYGLMPNDVSIRDDEDDDDDYEDGDEDDESPLPEHLGGGMFIKTELGSGIVVPRASPGSLKNKASGGGGGGGGGGGIGDAVHKMCMYCNYTTRWNIGDVKTHILVTHLKRFPYGCKFCGFTGRDKKKLKMHCRSQHPQAPPGTGFKYLYNEYANILVVKKIGKEMYIGVKGLDSIEAVEKASRMTMQELRALAGSDTDDVDDESGHPVPPIQTPVYPRSVSSDAADAMIKKHQLQLQQQLKSMSSSNTEEPLDLSVATQMPPLSAANALRDIHRSFVQEQTKGKRTDIHRKASEAPEPQEFTNKHLQCRKCGYVHFDMYKLKVHILGRHLKQKPYACSLCGFDDFASHKVSTHVAEAHGNVNAVMIKNIVQRDTEIKKYVGHVDTSKKLVRPYVRAEVINPNQPKPFECAYCNYQARSRAKIKYHSIRKHKHMEVKVIERGNNVAVPAGATPKSPTSTFTPMSAKGSNSQMPSPTGGSQNAMMLNPGVSIEPNQNFTCSKCLQPFPSEDELEAHEAKVHSVIGVYQCVYCPSRQRHQYKMKQHQRLKHPDSPIKMVLIHVEESQHRKKSSPVIPVRPPRQFGMGGAVTSTFNQKKVLNGVYQCNHCPSRISYKAKMNWHQRVKHPNQSSSYQFIPNELSEKAKAMAARRAKIVVPDWRTKLGKVAQKPQQDDMYKCKACNFATKDQFCMRNHAQAHTGYRPYKCPYCAYGNVKSFPVKMHVRKHHPNMPIKHKVERDHLKEAELREIYSSPVRKSKYRVDSNKFGPPPKKRIIEFKTPSVGGTRGVTTKEEPMSDDEQQPVPSASGAAASEVNIKPYCCTLCGHWSQNHTGIKRHLMWEIKYKPYACPHCAYRDVHASGIEVHCGKVHKDVPVESLYRRDPEKEAYIQNLIEQSRRKQTPRNVPVASPANKGATGRMSINTLKIIRRHGHRPTILHKCKECGFLTTKPKHMASHIVRHGPKRHQCGYCEFQAFYPYEISQHSSKFHPSLPIMSSLLGKKKPGQELIDIIKMTGPEIDQLMNGEVPTASPSGTVEIPLERPVKTAEVAEPPVATPKAPPPVTPQTKPGPKSFALKRQTFTSPAVSPMLDGLRIPEYEFNLNESGNYQCRYCDYENEALQHFKNHLIKHMPPRWKCFYCKCMTQLSYDLRKHIKNFHPGQEIKIVKLDPNLHPPHTFKPSRTGIAFTINLRDWKELIQGTAPPGRKDTDTVVVTEEDYTNMLGGEPIPIKQEAMDDFEDSTSDLRSEESDSVNSTLCFNCCYCPYSTRDTAIYAAHLQTHAAKVPVAGNEPHSDSEDSEAEELAVQLARARDHPPIVRVMDIMELNPVALEGLLHGNGVTSIRF